MEIFVTTLLLGIVTGSVYALAATGVVLTYKTSGILNLGYGALAVFTSYIYWQMAVGWGWPLWLSALLVLFVVAPAIGLFLDTQLFRRLEGQPQIIGVIATVGLFVLLRGVIEAVWEGKTQSVPSLFPSGSVRLFGDAYIGKDQLFVLGIALAAALGLGAMLRYTKLGVAFRAVVDNRPVAGLMGINTSWVSGLAWALGTSFAALVGMLLTPRTLLDPNFLPPFVIAFVLGASVVGYLRSLPLAYAGGVGLGVAEAFIINYGADSSILTRLRDALPFLMIVIAVLVAPKAYRVGSLGASFVVRTRESASSASPRSRIVIAGLMFGLLALMPVITKDSVSWQLSLIVAMSQAIVFISLVVLTGYSGQISLGHTAFMGLAVFSAAHVVQAGLPMWVAFPIGALAAAPIGALVGLVAVRLQGLFLALLTLALAFMAQSLFFSEPAISGGEGGIPVPRFEGFTGETGFFFITLVFLALTGLLAVNLRTGRTGRILAGMRDSETACRSLGIPVTRYKVLIFAMSASIAGVGALLNAMVLQQATSRTFLPFLSLIFTTIAVLGGIFHVGGALTSGMMFGLYAQVFSGTFDFMIKIQLIFFGLGSTLALAQNPEGTFGELRRGANALLRAFASRRRPEPAPVSGGQE